MGVLVLGRFLLCAEGPAGLPDSVDVIVVESPAWITFENMRKNNVQIMKRLKVQKKWFFNWGI